MSTWTFAFLLQFDVCISIHIWFEVVRNWFLPHFLCFISLMFFLFTCIMIRRLKICFIHFKRRFFSNFSQFYLIMIQYNLWIVLKHEFFWRKYILYESCFLYSINFSLKSFYRWWLIWWNLHLRQAPKCVIKYSRKEFSRENHIIIFRQPDLIEWWGNSRWKWVEISNQNQTWYDVDIFLKKSKSFRND